MSSTKQFFSKPLLQRRNTRTAAVQALATADGNNNAMDAVAMAEFTAKKWVWVSDKEHGYVPSFIVEEESEEKVTVQLESTGEKRNVGIHETEKMNPPKFDRVDDMADLAYLNEASVVHNLKLRHFADLIYTYSGLFLVAVNPYKYLPIYSDSVIRSYKSKRRSEVLPHIYAISDTAYHDMIHNRENQSILITGESGAGKTENTKKVIQYLTTIAGSVRDGTRGVNVLQNQILQANPILEAFGNAQTIRNNNSSRFGKFIRIEFNQRGEISGANIEWYLLEKSRVTRRSDKERNYHVFYQLLKGAPKDLREQLILEGKLEDFLFTKSSRKQIDGVDDIEAFRSLTKSMEIMGFSDEEQVGFFKVIVAILYLGNISPISDRSDQAKIPDTSVVERACHLLGVPVAEFLKGILRPLIKAGRDWVPQARNATQVVESLEALSRSLYERMFGKLVQKINETIDRPDSRATYIGVLDIAGFEIFDKNSFEQLCINYTNERLQQFFNHYMFVLEQEEYSREGIDWNFVDFGLDLQPTIDLIEKSNPVGILSCLDEECLVPKATDQTFMLKLNNLWKNKSQAYEPSRFGDGFMLHHYASKVEYSIQGWLEKNKDPLNENITKLLSTSSDKFIAELYVDCALDNSDVISKSLVKKGIFRTVAQKHKEQLSFLMQQLYSTEPHFVRCILPNQEKAPGKMNIPLVLDQLRCNGVLEGIRIHRSGFPNRLSFSEFRSRYEILALKRIPAGYIDGRKACQLLLDSLQLEISQYRIGSSKVFFKAGVLAQLEELRDAKLSGVITSFQAICRGYLARKHFSKRVNRDRAIRVIQKNARVYVNLREWPWWKLFSKVKPLLNVTRVDQELKQKETLISELEDKLRKEEFKRKAFEGQLQKLEAERRLLEQTLMHERSAALDQQEMLKRKQERELALQELLKENETEMDSLHNRLEEALKVKAKLEQESREQRALLEERQATITKMEREKTEREREFNQLNTSLQIEKDRVESLAHEKKDADSRISLLQTEIVETTSRESNLLKVKHQLEQKMFELQSELNVVKADKETLQSTKLALEEEADKTKSLIIELENAKKESGNLLRSKETEIHTLQLSLQAEKNEISSIEKKKKELQLKYEIMGDELESVKKEAQRLQTQKQAVEAEAAELQQLMESKGAQESKQTELYRQKESELQTLRSKISGLQAELDEASKKTSSLVTSLKNQLQEAEDQLELFARTKQNLESRVLQLSTELETLAQKSGELERTNKALESDLDAARDRLRNTETLVTQLRASREETESRLLELSAENENLQSDLLRLERERSGFELQLTSAKAELEDEQRRRATLEVFKRNLTLERSDLESQLNEERTARLELQDRLNNQTIEYENLSAAQGQGDLARQEELEAENKRLVKEFSGQKEKLEEVERNCLFLERTKARLTSEVEDLRHEVEREHGVNRSMEKKLKQAEFQLESIKQTLESERQEKELLSSNVRKLQLSIDSLTRDVKDKEEQRLAAIKSKNELEGDLKSLINEISEGGRNITELEKSKRALLNDFSRLQQQVTELEVSRSNSERKQKETDVGWSKKYEQLQKAMLEQKSQHDEAKSLLLAEINILGSRLDDEEVAKEKLLKEKKQLEEVVEDLRSTADMTVQSKSDLEKAKSSADNLIRELRSQLEAEELHRRNFEELAIRYEKKANLFQADLESVEKKLAEVELLNKKLENKIEILEEDTDSENSKNSLILALQSLREEHEKTLQQLNSEKPTVMELSNIGNGSSNAELDELRQQVTQLDESKRALLVAQKRSQQELSAKDAIIENLEEAKKTLLAELKEAKSMLNAEIAFKESAEAGKYELSLELNNIKERYDLELGKTTELNETISNYRSRIESLLQQVEDAEIVREKTEKTSGNLKSLLSEHEVSLKTARSEQAALERRVQELQRELDYLQANQEDNAMELEESRNICQRLKEEMELSEVKFQQELQTSVSQLNEVIQKNVKQIKQLTQESEDKQSVISLLTEAKAELDAAIEELETKLEEESNKSASLKKEKERLEAKISELLKECEVSEEQVDELRVKISSLKTENVQLQTAYDESEAKREILEKAKKSLEAHITEMSAEYSVAYRSRHSLERSSTNKGQEGLIDELEKERQSRLSAEGKASKLENAILELQEEVGREREKAQDQSRQKALLEKQLKDANMKIVELESNPLASSKPLLQRRDSKTSEFTNRLEMESRERSNSNRQLLKQERTIRELQQQLVEKEKTKTKVEEELRKVEQRMDRMRQQIDDLESSESKHLLSYRRAEREANEQRERAVRLERELEKLKSRLNPALASRIS